MPCGACGSATTRSCKACSMVKLCSETCEKALWFEHKDQCEGSLQKLVDRTGLVLREVFYIFSERAFNTDVNDIAKGPDGIVIFESAMDVQQTRQSLFPFPAHLVPNVEDRHAVLCANRSEQALGFLHGFVTQMLRGAPFSKVEEIEAHIRESPKAVILSRGDYKGNRYHKTERHRFLRVQGAIHSRKWTLDPAGAVYGVKGAATAASSHEKSYLKDAQLTFRVFGYHEKKLGEVADSGHLSGLSCKVLFVARDYLHSGVDVWMTQTHLTLPELLRLPDVQFVSHLGRLRTCIHSSMSQITTSNEYRLAMQDALP